MVFYGLFDFELKQNNLSDLKTYTLFHEVQQLYIELCKEVTLYKINTSMDTDQFLITI